jgi:hypothetical protein
VFSGIDGIWFGQLLYEDPGGEIQTERQPRTGLEIYQPSRSERDL